MAEFLPPRHEVPEPFVPTPLDARPLASSAANIPAPRARTNSASSAQTAAPIARSLRTRRCTARACLHLRPPHRRALPRPRTIPPSPPSADQIVCFGFYKVHAGVAPPSATAEKSAHKEPLLFAAVHSPSGTSPAEFLSLTYSTIGTRAATSTCARLDDQLWCRRAEPDALQAHGHPARRLPQLPAQLPRHDQALGVPDRPLRRERGRGPRRHPPRRPRSTSSVYPFWKTRPWYLLPMAERKRLMD